MAENGQRWPVVSHDLNSCFRPASLTVIVIWVVPDRLPQPEIALEARKKVIESKANQE
jgi:hypothetical protein